MLSLKQSLSLSSIDPLWNPYDEASLVAWYANKTGISITSGNVSTWLDSSSNTHNMTNATLPEQPLYVTASGALGFDPAKTQNLQTSSQISLTGAFTIGIRLNPSAVNVTVLAELKVILAAVNAIYAVPPSDLISKPAFS